MIPVGRGASENEIDGPGIEDADVLDEQALLASRILIVDDDEIVCRLISSYLTETGYQNVDLAHDGRTGLEKIRRTKPDLVILDLSMPVMDGEDVLREVRADPVFNDTPIIVETAKDTQESRNEVLRIGATNVISKPIHPEVLLGQVHTHLERKILVASLKAYQVRVREELEAARSMQIELLPLVHDIEEICLRFDVRLESHFQPSSELAGDWWGTEDLGTRGFSLFSVDFTGHGVGAAINTFRLQSVMSRIDPMSMDPAAYLEEINRRLVGLIPRGQFATMLYAICDPKNHKITYAACGAPSPIFGRIGSSELSVGESAGLPLGISEAAVYTNHEFPFEPGSFMFLYSDALIETPGKDAPPIEDKGLLDLIRQTASRNSDQTEMKFILDEFFRRSVTSIPDDLTTIWLQRNSSG